MIGLLDERWRDCIVDRRRVVASRHSERSSRDRGTDMKIATWQGESRFTLDKVPEPVAGPGQVVVAVHAAGICGTDVHATQGLFPWKPPLVLGHEYTGVVRQVGRGVDRRLVGRMVGCEPSYGCGACAECAAGRVSQCPKCVRVGGFAERVVLPARNVHPLPRGLDPVTAAMTEPAACCLAGLETFQMPRGATVLVIGGGIMGLVTMVLARRRGARRLILSDPIEERRQMARRLGASVVIDPVRESLRDKVMELTGGRGADVVCEAVGKPELVAEAIALTKPTGFFQLVGMLALDLGQIYNGPYCGLLLGFMGARVLKIESPEGDIVRRRKRQVEPYPLVMLNSNKESVVLDLKHADGKALFLRLARKADVVVENFAVGVMNRLGLGWDVLQKENSRLAYGSGPGLGLSRPDRALPAMDLTIQAMSGIMNATGFPHRAPVKAGPAVCDFLGGLHLFAGILGALLQRERTGQGQFVEVAMLDAAIIALASALGVFMDGDTSVPPRTGNRHPALAMAPYNVYETRDGHIAIFTASDRHWESITRVLGREDLLMHPDYATTPGRAARVEQIDAMVTAWTRERTKNEVMAILTDAHVPCAPVRTAAEVVVDPHLNARGVWQEIEHPRRGKTKVPISPIRLHGAEPAAVARPAPLLGQDTDRVLGEILGLNKDDLDALHAAGVIEPVKT